MYSKLKRIWRIQEPRNKRRVIIAVTLLFLSSIFDLIGVASVLPFLLSLANPDIIQENYFLLKINSYLNLDKNNFIFFLAFSSFVLIVVNQLLRLLSKWYSMTLSENLLYENSKNLFYFYLNKPYKFFLDKNDAHLLQRCTNYVNSTVGGYITPALLIFGNFLTSTLILVFLLIYNPFITIILFLSLSIFYVGFFNQIKKQISKLSKAIPKHYANTAKTIGDAFGSIKESLMSNNSKYFLDRFAYTANDYKNAHVKLNLINQLPNVYIEIFSYGILLTLFLILFLFSENFFQVIPLLGIIALALKRLIPAAQDIYAQLLLVKFYKETYKKIVGDLEDSFEFNNQTKSITSNSNKKINFYKNIKFEKIKFSYKPKSKNIISLDGNIKKGEFIGICGISGHGKTTFLDIFCGLLTQKSGRIIVDKTELKEYHLNNWKTKIGYIPQLGYLLNDTISNNIVFGSNFKKDYKKLKKILRIVELDSFLKKNKYNYNTRVGENGVRLSGGQQQRLIAARALYQNPEIIVLDEATNALDQDTAKKVILNIRKNFRDATILFVTHRVEALRKCDKILLFHDGNIHYEGKYNLLLKNKYFKKLQLIQKEKIN